jgi:hypothetical protein
MEYRRLDYSEDIKEVVALIRRNLNPEYSENILRWKHLESPFGLSVGLVAVDEGKIQGVVFAALYKFQNSSGEKISAIRFFDACTEPDQRGKGVFKTLMKMGFEAYENEIDFSFSNPNEASLKGHLRVGYEEPVKKIFYRLGLIKPLIGKIEGDFEPSRPEVLNEKSLTKQDFYLAGNNLSFLNWRYREKRYKIWVHRENCEKNYIVYRIEKKKGIRTIVLCDYFGDIRDIQKVLHMVCRREKTFLIYYLENRVNAGLKFLFTKKHKKAVVVFKNGHTLSANLVISLGDLEGRL